MRWTYTDYMRATGINFLVSLLKKNWQNVKSLHIKSTMQRLIAEHTGQTLDQIETDSDRDRWFTAEQAKEYGFIDHVYVAAAQIPSDEAPNQ